MGKHSKDKAEKAAPAEAPEEERPEYEELVTRVNTIAQPLAGKKLTKRLYKTVKKGSRCLPSHVLCSARQRALFMLLLVDLDTHVAAKAKSLRRGVKEVQKCLRKGEKG